MAKAVLVEADAGKWSVKQTTEGFKRVMGEPEKKPKPKAIECPSCGKWKVDMQDETYPECPWCIIKTLEEELIAAGRGTTSQRNAGLALEALDK